MALRPAWGSDPPSMYMGGGQENLCRGCGQTTGLLPARSSNFFLYIYINATVLLWSIKDPLEILSGGLP